MTASEARLEQAKVTGNETGMKNSTTAVLSKIVRGQVKEQVR